MLAFRKLTGHDVSNHSITIPGDVPLHLVGMAHHLRYLDIVTPHTATYTGRVYCVLTKMKV